jgi:hypothetical protein
MKRRSTKYGLCAAMACVVIAILVTTSGPPAHAARSSKPKEIVVVGSKVKEVIREAGLRSDGELVQAVSDKVHELLQEAITRCKANGRSTVRPYDL